MDGSLTSRDSHLWDASPRSETGPHDLRCDARAPRGTSPRGPHAYAHHDLSVPLSRRPHPSSRTLALTVECGTSPSEGPPTVFRICASPPARRPTRTVHAPSPVTV